MILLDTHTLVWLTEGNKILGEQSKSIIQKAFTEQKVFVSAISFWEVAILNHKHLIYFAVPVSDWRNRLLNIGLQEISLTGEIAIKATCLQNFHSDPADRFIVATGILYDAILITADKLILDWNGQLKKQNARK